MRKILIITVTCILLFCIWYTLNNIYNIDIANIAVEKIKTYPVGSHIISNVAERSVLGVFYIFVLFSLVIIPGPIELTFLAILATSQNKMLTLVIAIVGVLTGQLINYGLGRILSKLWQPEPKTKERINKFGGWFIFIGSIVPFLPSQLFNFAAGTVKLPFKKWVVAITIGVTLYLTAITLAAKQLISYFS